MENTDSEHPAKHNEEKFTLERDKVDDNENNFQALTE